MTDQTDLAGLGGLYCSIDTATELLAAFISLARSGEPPTAAVLEAANKAVLELAGWRAQLGALAQRDDNGPNRY